ncbi:YidB family protein [Neptunomonas phycophila]|jgi:uncharacterized protein YidB (DUF937 family)|uniref:YidB family protein n=1 Tax=Neptunomonas phycophila TaxID=1572645 RepID=A0AAW7XKW5_9GAMM|nr:MULTISPECIES: YidB family protein [Neptunomonas]MBT3144611.1 DUF937 domain-containing protein [Neptunomonas phycophila]MDN2660756.1 YidB family protein [Neptunomonas sp. CHC150]MDO6453697.1 YidB family protein [Neptunomonas phycophila]MDO6467993.1 YidB family protein [Neptunomonas phycophila]MDO6784038.1 YidB family protein [Neptunomonas phycophila]
MDLVKMATQLFLNKLGTSAGGLDPDMVSNALSSLLGGGNGDLNLSDLISKVSGSGLGALAQSWLGDGQNDSFSISDVLSVLGESNVAEFSNQIGVPEQETAGALSDMIPELIDQNSSAGGLLESVGGVGGLAGLASSFFK